MPPACFAAGCFFFFSYQPTCAAEALETDSYSFDIGRTRCIFFGVLTCLRSFSGKHKERAVLCPCESIFMCAESWMEPRKIRAPWRLFLRNTQVMVPELTFGCLAQRRYRWLAALITMIIITHVASQLRSLSVSQTKMIVLKTLDYYYHYYYPSNKSLAANSILSQ